MQRYCLDTSVLINGWHKRYRPDVFPSIWATISDLMLDATVFSCEEVYLELKEQDDDLFKWADERRKSFLQPDEYVNDEMLNVMARFPNLAARGASLNKADPWIVAVARVSGAVVVTDEQPSEKSRSTKPPKLPNVCEALNVQWMRPIDFLAAMKIKF
jgi:predicted nucleic acid-binding protein